ncbi:reverse transcriptase domain-containing protein [Tanacetum coccineum]
MHTRASNSKLVEPLPEPERTLNRRLRRRNRRVPYDQRNNPPQHPRIASNHVVALTPGSAITIPETVNEFAIKANHLTLVKGNQFDGRAKTDPHKHFHEFLRISDMFKYRDTKNEAVRLMMFPLSLTREAKTWLDKLNEGTIETWDELRTAFISRFFPPALFDQLLGEICNIIKIFYHGLSEITQEVLNATAGGSSISDTEKIMAPMDAMTIKMDVHYKELQSRAKQPTPDLDDDDMPMSREEEAKFMKTFCKTRFKMITGTDI